MKTRRNGRKLRIALFSAGMLLGAAGAGEAQQMFTPGLVKFEMYDLSDRDINDLSVSVLTSHPSFPDSPTQVMYIRSMDTKQAFPDRTVDQFGSRMTALFVPPTSGNWIFYLRSDDASELWFNPNGTDPAGRIKIAEETECCHLFGETSSAPQALVAGQMYYIETLHREGPEYDYCQVAAKPASDPANPDFLLPISHLYLGILADPAGTNITSDPAGSVVGVMPAGTTNPILLASDFEADNGGFTATSANPIGPWTYSPADGTWMATGHADCAAAESTMLSSPAVTIDYSDDLYLMFSHRYSFQYDGVSYDGGQVRFSVNGGPYTALPANRFLAGGYTGFVQGSNALNGQQGFIATRRGHQSGYYTTSVARLGQFDPGDTISVQFMAAWDACTRGDYPDWEIDSVWITHTVTPIDVHAAGSIVGTGSVPVAHTWQVDDGSGYVNVGSIEETLWIAPTSADNGTHFRAALAIPGLAVYSEPQTLRITRLPVCQLTGPYAAACASDRAGLVTQADASGSSDPDGESLSFAWSADTPGVTFEPSDSPTPTVYFGAGMAGRANTMISVTVTDEAGANVTCSTNVDTSLSTIPPTLTLNGGDQNYVCDGSGANQYVELGASAMDGCGRAIDPIISPSADTRRKGTQVVTYDAVDVFGNAAPQLSRTVTVEEPDPVLVDVPGDLVTECSAPGGALKTDSAIADYLGGPAAVDGCDADESVINDAPDLLPLGTTQVTWQVWDNGPTSLTGSASITVQDTLAPVVNCAPMELPVDDSGSAVVPAFTPQQLNATDACTAPGDLTIVQTPAPGTVLPVGAYDLAVTVSDATSPAHTSSCSTTLEVTRLDVGGATPDGCGAPACGSAPLSLSATLLGLFAIKLLAVARTRK